MKVKLATIMAGPEGCFPVGSVIDVSKEEAKQLIDGGHAYEVKPQSKKAAEPEAEPSAEGQEETAEGEAGEETADAPRGRGRRGGRRG